MDKKLLWWIFGVSRGGPVRAKIVKVLHDRPYNANQLATEIKVDYKTIRYHLNILLKNNVVTTLDKGNIVMYFLSDAIEKKYEDFLEIYKKVIESENQ